MKKYKTFGLKLDGIGPETVGPFIIEGKDKSTALETAQYHIRNHMKIEGNYNISVDLI